MKGGTLAVMMWKHLMVRTRRFIQTPVEFVSPVLFFILLVLSKNVISPPMPDFMKDMNGTTSIPDIVSLSTFNAPPLILYYPENKLTNKLMESVGASLNARHLTNVPATIMRRGVAYAPLSEEAYQGNFSALMSHDDALVIFQNMDEDDWPDKLMYTIRMKKQFYTNQYNPMDNMHPHLTFGTDYESFMRLQWAIDTSFTEMQGVEITQNVWVQEFPHFRPSGNHVMEVVCKILSVLCWLSLLLVFVFLTSRLLAERATGIQELMKMVGVSSNVLVLSNFLNVLPAGLIYSIVGTILLKVTSNPLIPKTSGVLIFLMLLLHFITVVCMAFACSYIVTSTQYAVTVSVTAYVALWMPEELLSGRELAPALLALSGLLPHVPMTWFWNEVAALEDYGNGLSFTTMFSSHSPLSGSVFLGLVLMVAQSVLFLLASWYLSRVRPGQYGQAMPWNFLCQKQYWSKSEVTPDSESEEEAPIAQEAKYFEEPHKNMDVGIKICNVSKIYPKHKALSNVSLDVYKGEITVLVGHNGAGKTTLMSIITGMTSASEGKVYVNGFDVASQRNTVRNQLGLCPQHNLFFPDLNVIEHVKFFTLLKGVTFKEAHESSMKLLKQLGLEGKAHSSSEQLSGGMKRRLQLACALAGDAAALLLDEPTSGLDVETRRELWDLLLSLRGSRTVLLTTHFMEEADALGDRVAALHAGRLRCHATPMHLKKAIGTGYRLSFTTIGLPKESAITAVITAVVPEAGVKEATLNSISYNLPAHASDKFPELFTSLEDQRSRLAIDSIGVGVSTLEEVFLKLCSDVDTTFTDDEVDGTAPESTMKTLTGPLLYFRHMSVLLKRQFKYLLSKKISFLILQVILPIIMICAFTNMTQTRNQPADSTDKVVMNLDLYKDMPTRRVLYHLDTPTRALRTINDNFPKVQFEDTEDVASAVLQISRNDALEYNKYLVGLEVNNNDIKVLYTTLVRHAAPVALNLAANVAANMAASLGARAASPELALTNHPLSARHRTTSLVEAKSMDNIIFWAYIIVFIFLATILNAVSLPCVERASGARRLHVMAGCAAALYWLCTLLFHTALCAGVLILTIVISAGAMDADHTFNQPEFLLTLTLILILGSISFFGFMYLISFKFAERGAAIILVIVIFVFCVITPASKSVIDFIREEEKPSVTRVLLTIAEYIAPPHTLNVAVVKAGNVARTNAYCSLNKAMCPNLFAPHDGSASVKCCVQNVDPQCYFCFEEDSPAKNIIILLAQGAIFMTLVVLTQHGIFNGLYDRVVNARYRPPATPAAPAGPAARDDMVRAEAVYVEKQIALPTKQIPDAILVNDVHKNYFQVFGKSCNAVKGVSFSVKKGECFGLLGVNGAGKSTTFKMLTGEECTTRGTIFANGHHLKKEQGSYLRSLGYCPQFSGLDVFLTGRENLTLLLTLRGLSAADVTAEVNSWIEVVGLSKYADRAVSGYSGGCARRLAAAAALCRGAPAALLDEPSAGVDAAARRRLWAALRRARAAGRALLVTSHSMDEMEALCSRIGIMSGGALVALGSPAALRARFAKGHAVVIKVKPAPADTPTLTSVTPERDEVDSAKWELNSLKGKLQELFNCTLKDEHKTMLHYHINETMRYSDLFKMLEQLKATFPSLIEDYSVTETTLEEVFLSFAEKKSVQTATV